MNSERVEPAVVEHTETVDDEPIGIPDEDLQTYFSGCLTYNLLPRKNKKIIKCELVNYYSIWTEMGIFELWLYIMPIC